MIISWIPPFDQGSPITSYTIYIRQNDGVSYSLEPFCDGATASTISAAQCSVPVGILRTSPYNLPWGSRIFAKVIAMNKYGSSSESLPGSGGILMTNPDAPIDLSEMLSGRTNSTLGL